MNARIWLAAPVLAIAVGVAQYHASRAIAAAPAAAGGQDTSTLDDQSELSLTVYNSDLALVRDVRSLQLPRGTFDLKFMDSLVDDPEWATQYSIHELVEKTGTQGVELLMWLATRGAVPGRVRKVHTNYHIPISNTAAGMMALEAQS